jgi:hypothetical protein
LCACWGGGGQELLASFGTVMQINLQMDERGMSKVGTIHNAGG